MRIPRQFAPCFEQQVRQRRPGLAGFRMLRLIAVTGFVGHPAERTAIGLGRVKTLEQSGTGYCLYRVGRSRRAGLPVKRCSLGNGGFLRLRRYRRYERFNAHDVHDAREVVGQHV